MSMRLPPRPSVPPLASRSAASPGARQGTILKLVPEGATARPGWGLPLSIDGRGAFPERRRDELEDTVRLIVEVAPGERPLLPSFGCRIHELARIATEAERHAAATLVEDALERWAPWLGVRRVEVVEVEAPALRLRIVAGAEDREVEVHWRGGSGADGGEDPEGAAEEGSSDD